MDTISLPVLANAAIKKNQLTTEGSFRLCRFGEFGFVQNRAYDERKVEFGEQYKNDQSNSPIFQAHMESVYRVLKENFSKGAKLVEVGCGQGSFLNIIESDSYFSYKGFDRSYDGENANIEGRFLNNSDSIDADVVVLRHVLDYLKNPCEFIGFLKKIFPSSASIFIEIPQFEWIVDNKIISDFAYERINYFNTESLISFFTKVTEHGDFFEGQYQYCLAKLSSFDGHKWNGFEDERRWNDFDFSPYVDEFQNKMVPLKNFERLWIWGGGNKGVMFLTHLSYIYPTLLAVVCGVIDINPKKQAYFTPSTYIEIISPSAFFDRCCDGDAVIVMNPNYFNEVENTVKKSVSKSVTVLAF